MNISNCNKKGDGVTKFKVVVRPLIIICSSSPTCISIDYLPLNVFFIFFEKKKAVNLFFSAFERKHLKEKFTYLYLTNSQYLSAYILLQISSAIREIIHTKNISNHVTCKKKRKNTKKKMSHVTVIRHLNINNCI